MNAPLLDRRMTMDRGGGPPAVDAAGAAGRSDSNAPAGEGQSPASADPVRATFAACFEAFRDGLLAEGLRPAALPADWASAEARGGRFRLRAYAWRKEASGSGEAFRGAVEGRAATVQGPNCEIITCLIFPDRTDRTPVFAAELVAQGGLPRVAFLDLQTPGLEDRRRTRVADAAREAREGFPEADRDEAPEWAMRDGSGFHLFSRGSGGAAVLPRWREAFQAYLLGWRRVRSTLDERGDDVVRDDVARDLVAGRGGGGTTDAAEAARAAARSYKAGHVSHSPGTPFLRTVFGAAWTDRFLEEFLYG